MLNGGAAKIARSGFTTFGKADGFSWASSILETRAGDLHVVGASDQNKLFINRFDGEKFSPVSPAIHFSWGWNQTMLEDRAGEWWMATYGVSRFPKADKSGRLANTPSKARYTTRDGLAADSILRLFEDSRGDVWIGSVGEGRRPNGLSRWERSTGLFHHYTEKDNLPRLDTFFVSSFAEDRAGNLWIGFSGDGGLVRYRDGRFTLFTTTDGLLGGSIRNLFLDSAGRLWLPSYRGGLSRIDDPAAQHPRFVTYTTANGLSSNEVTTVTEDQWGRIYIGTGRGIDRLDPATGRVKHYTTADGLPLGEMQASLRDRRGALWFSFVTGLVRLVPEPDLPPAPPPILITGLRVAGEAQPISALGQIEIAPVDLGANRNQIHIDFVALGFSPGEALRYQYMLEGSGEDWSRPTEQRTVNFANLAPGQYRFLVRAVNADGVASETPASFSFTILPPFWQRWWFIAIAVAMAVIAVYTVYSYRVARLLELERVRTRIAADLHDDIGSSLSQISILSEVLRKQLGKQEARVSKNLLLINRVSQEALDSMSDIVWAINPQQDHLSDLVRRMRRVASEVLPARNIEFGFNAPTAAHDLRLGADIRRQVFLMFKETINNIVRHSGCARVEIELKIEGAWLALVVADNGKGFDPNRIGEGNGLVSLRRRARSFGGETVVSSREGEGTTVTIRIPHSRHIRLRSDGDRPSGNGAAMEK